jgi:hypothetical protein
VIVWKLMADLNFAGEGDILSDSFKSLKSADDPSVSKIIMIEIKPAEIGRLFKSNHSEGGKTELRRGYPSTITDGCFDIAETYGDILPDMDGQLVLMTMDADTWVMSITFFKEGTSLVKASLSIPDCPGAITQALSVIAGWNVNLISVFSKIKVCYQSMNLELFMDVGKCEFAPDELRVKLEEALGELNGEFGIVEFKEIA